MNGYLLDTNVISELTKPVPTKSVIAFLSETRDLWISTVTLHELTFGIGLMPKGKRRETIAQTVDTFTVEYHDRIIPIEQSEVREAALLRAGAQKTGQIVSLGDALIAGTARAHALAVVTRNVADFQGLGVDLINPWED